MKNIKINKKIFMTLLLSSVILVKTKDIVQTKIEYDYDRIETENLKETYVKEQYKDNKTYLSENSIENPIDFAKLKQTNSDIVAWITDGDSIDYPVFQTTNNEFYLNHNIEKEESSHGSIFLDYRCDFSDQLIGIYGHNMKDGSMFKTISNYKSQEYYNEHKEMKLYTEDEIYNIVLFAGLIVDENSMYLGNFESEETFDLIMNDIYQKSTFKSNVDCSYGDNLIYLCTCSYEYQNARYVLYGKLERQMTNNKQKVKVYER